MFSDLIGNEEIKQTLTRMIEKGAATHSLLFSGPSGIGKTLFALKFAEQLLGRADHPDLHIYRPEGKVGMHSIESMRAFCREVYLAPFEASSKVLILQDAERMLPTSSNALLKTFEEPAPTSLIILITAHPEQLLPTVVSRCRTLHFKPLSDEQVATFLKQPIEVASLAGGSIGAAYSLLEEKSVALRQKALEILMRGPFPDYAHLAQASKELADLMEQDEGRTTEEIYSGALEDLTASQKSEIEKEVEGRMRLKQSDLLSQIYQVLSGPSHAHFWNNP